MEQHTRQLRHYTGSAGIGVLLTVPLSVAIFFLILTLGVPNQLFSQTNTVPNQPGSITGSASACIGSSQTYSVVNVSGLSYTWTVPAGWTITSGAGLATLNVTIGSAGQNGNIAVTAGNSYGSSAASTLAVSVVTIPSTPGTIAGPSSLCEYSTGNIYSVAAVPGATSYSWIVPADWLVTSGAGTNSIIVGTGSPLSGTVTVTASNSCGTSTAQAKSITVNALPQISISSDYCNYQPQIQLTALGGSPGATYVWSTSPAQSTQVIYVNTADPYSVTVTENSCSATAYLGVSNELVTDGKFTNFNPASPSFITGYIQNQSFYSGISSSGLWPEGTYAVNMNAWSNYPNSPSGYHTSFHGRDHTNNTLGPRNFMMVNGSVNTNQTIWQETITVQPNTEYYFSAWGMNLNPAFPAQLRFEVNTVQVGTIADLNIAPKPTNESQVNLYNWVRFYSTHKWNSGSATTAVIRIVNLITTGGGNDFGLDDISFGTFQPKPIVMTAQANGGAPICEGNTISLSANITSGGTPPLSYLWTRSTDTWASTNPGPVISPATLADEATYTVTITNGNECTYSSSTAVTVLPLPLTSLIYHQ